MEKQAAQIHVFEDAGMGKAPFKLVGFFKMPSSALAEANPAAYQNALREVPRNVRVGSCSYCGTGLINNFIIRSSDGNMHAVGCDCVDKTGDRGLVDAIKLQKRKLARAEREKKRQAELEAKQAARRAEEDKQREKNGGLTDEELAEQAREAVRAKFDEQKSIIRDAISPLLDAIRPQRDKSDFVRNVGHDIHCIEFNNISVNMWRIIKEVAAKQTGGRKNSKAYNAEYERYTAIVDAAKSEFQKAQDAFTKALYAL